jgi:hypothetical protein
VEEQVREGSEFPLGRLGMRCLWASCHGNKLYHKLGDLEQEPFFFPHTVLEARSLKCRCGQCCAPLKFLGKTIPLGAPGIPWFVATSLQFLHLGPYSCLLDLELLVQRTVRE